MRNILVVLLLFVTGCHGRQAVLKVPPAMLDALVLEASYDSCRSFAASSYPPRMWEVAIDACMVGYRWGALYIQSLPEIQ